MKEKDYFFTTLCLSVIFFTSLIFTSTLLSNNSKHVCAKEEDRSDRIGCWERTVETLMQKESPEKALKLLKEIKKTDLMFSSDCHVYAHLIGEISYWKYRMDGDFEIDSESKLCDYGFYHGFMQEMGHHDESFFDKAPKLCDLLTNKLGSSDLEDTLNQCYHGIGHGVVYSYIDTLSKQEIEITKRGVEYCEKITDPGDRRLDCVFGIYGGLSSLYFGSHGYLWPMKDEDPFWICPQQPSIYQKGCFVGLIPAVYSHWEFDLKTAIKRIKAIKNIEYAKESFLYSGSVLSHKIVIGSKSPEEIISLCQKISRGLNLYCIEGVGGGIYHYSLPETAEDKAIFFCSINLLTEKEKNYCFKGIKELPGMETEQTLKNFCQKVNKDNQKYCLNEKY